MKFLPMIRFVAALVVAQWLVLDAAAKTLRLFVVGNSFSNNATRFLPEIVAEGGHELISGRAMTGGCSFARHWNAVEVWKANPQDPKAKIYSGKSLQENIEKGTWDVITFQQYSLHSGDLATYRPYVEKLHAHLRQLQPQARIFMHQTWAYRADAAKFGQVAKGEHAKDNREMWEKSRAAYWTVARELRTPVIPTGDAFWRVSSDPTWGFKPDASFDAKTARHPALPKEENSLHVGYRWNADKKLGKDANHANAAGEYLGALVWYAVLFDEAPEKVKFVPPGVDAAFAAQLRKVAGEVAREVAAENRKLGGR